MLRFHHIVPFTLRDIDPNPLDSRQQGVRKEHYLNYVQEEMKYWQVSKLNRLLHNQNSLHLPINFYSLWIYISTPTSSTFCPFITKPLADNAFQVPSTCYDLNGRLRMGTHGHPSKHEAFIQFCIIVGPLAKTVGRHWNGFGWMPPCLLGQSTRQKKIENFIPHRLIQFSGGPFSSNVWSALMEKIVIPISGHISTENATQIILRAIFQ